MKATIEQVENQPAEYLRRVMDGETIVVYQGARAVAEIRPLTETEQLRPVGLSEGEFVVPDDFDDPLPADLVDATAHSAGERVLADERGVWLQQLDPPEFCRRAAEHLPHIAADLREHGALLHLQVEVLREELLRNIASGDLSAAMTVTNFLGDVLDPAKPAPELANALQISFVTREELESSVAGRQLLERMPARLRRLLS